MNSPLIDSNLNTNTYTSETQDNDLQKPNIYNKYSPFNELIKQHAFAVFEEIRENLSRTIQLGELQPGFSVWSNQLTQFIALYEFHFNKIDHLKLVNLYLSILSITDLNYEYAKLCFDVLSVLMRKTRLLTRNDLTIDWRIFYRWIQLIRDNHDKTHALIILPEGTDMSLFGCVRLCSPYFSAASTQEILDELRPRMCPIDLSFDNVIDTFEHLLPLKLPPDLHDRGFKLWLSEFFSIWESICSLSSWKLYLIDIFSSVAWNNIGYINWEPWMPQIFTRILRSFSLPIGKTEMSSQEYSYPVSYSTKWIVAMIGNGSSCLPYLRDLLVSMTSFYHPSNTGDFKQKLVEFILKLAENFVDRVHLERRTYPVWYFAPLESHRLTEQDITDFVNCIKEYVFISIFNQDYAEEAAQACKYLSILRPESIVPVIVDKHFSSIDSMVEPHRFTAIVTCLKYIVRQIVQQTPSYSQGQTYVLPLLMSVLPGIDLNDCEKTSVTAEFLSTIMTVITCVDCSSAVNTRNDLTEIEKEVCLSTANFKDFIMEFLNRIFQMIDILSADMSHIIAHDTYVHIDDTVIITQLASIMFSIVHQCSTEIFQKIRDKVLSFVSSACLLSRARDIISSIIVALVKGNPIETLKYFLPKICRSIEQILNNSESIVLLTDHKEDIELNWYLFLFATLLRAHGNTLLIYKNMIMSVFHQCIGIVNKNSYETIANAVENLLESLSQIYLIDYRLTVDNIDEKFVDFLPIRAWGQSVNFDQVHVQFHISNEDEIDFACEFINTFIYPELTLLNEKGLEISNNERLRSLTIVQSIAIGCFRMISRIESKPIQDYHSMLPIESKYRIKHTIYSKELKLKEHLRMRLFIDIGKLLDRLMENHCDDVLSITKALKFYSLTSLYYGIFGNRYNDAVDTFRMREYLLKNKLSDEGRMNRLLIIEKIALQIQGIEMSNFGLLSEIDKQSMLKLFELSIHRYSEIRSAAQNELFCFIKSYPFSYQVIVDRIVELFNKSDTINHDQIKGCLYILLGDDSYFLPTKHSWTMKEKLWPAIVRMTDTTKNSIQDLIQCIHEKIYEKFDTQAIIQYTNDLSRQAAVTLWHPLELREIETHKRCNQSDIASYNNLMEALNSLLMNDTLTWGQQKITMSFVCLLLQRNVPISSSCIRTFVNFLLHDNIELRQYATRFVAALGRLQKPPRIYVEKSLEDILRSTGKPIPAVINQESCPGDRDDNLWLTIDDHKPPQTQIEWEETCFLNKSFHGYYTWPKMIKYTINKRTRYTQENMPEEVAILYDRFTDKNFIVRATQLMILDEKTEDKDFDRIRFTMFKGLFRNFGLAFLDNFIEQLYVLVHEEIKEKKEGSYRVAAEIVAGMIRGSKHWTLEMLDKLWEKLTPFLIEVCNNLNFETLKYWKTCLSYSMEDQDPRRMYRLIDFLRTLINTKATSNTFNEFANWSLIRHLNEFGWRIPSIWREINEHVKELLDHPYKNVRERIAILLGVSHSFDVELFNGKSTRQLNINQFVHIICEQLQQAIETYEKAPPIQARQALNFIETIIQMHAQFFWWCQQPIKNGIIHFFPYLCEIETVEVNDEAFQENLTISRLNVGLSYLNTDSIEALIQQLSKICTSSKWRARRAAIEFAQNMIFSNLFNARSHAQQLRELVIQRLFDEQYEVRIAASMTLSGFYQCGFTQVTNEDLNRFRAVSQTKYFTNINGKKVTLPQNVIKRHGGILGLCAIVLSSPYDIPSYVPDALMLLCEHSRDPHLIQKSIKTCLSEFRRTHHDSWHEHREQFTDDQLMTLADIHISHNYYV